MVNTNCNTLNYNTYPKVWEINCLLDHDFSMTIHDRKPLTEIVIVELKIKNKKTLTRN